MPSKHDEILQEAADAQVEVTRCATPAQVEAVYVRAGDRAVIAVDERLDEAEATCGCARALGHHMTGGGNQLSACALEAERVDCRSGRWAHDRLIPLAQLAEMALQYDGNPYAMAEALEVTVSFLLEAVRAYRDIHGVKVRIPGYDVTFIPGLFVRRA